MQPTPATTGAPATASPIPQFLLTGTVLARGAITALLMALCGCDSGASGQGSGSTPVDRLINLRFTPPAFSGYAKQTAVNVDLSNGEALEFQLKPSHKVRGWIWNPDTMFGAMQATVTFFSRNTVPGVRAPRFTGNTDPNKPEDGFPFSLELPGGLYDVLIEPSNSDLPPVWFPKYLVDQSGDMAPFHYVPEAERNELRGTVHLLDAARTELGGLFVQGFDDFDFPVSTLAETGTEGSNGDFKLTFPPGKGPYKLRVWPPQRSDGTLEQYYPTVEYNGWVDFEDPETGAVSGRKDLPRMSLPMLTGDKFVTVPITVHGQVISAEDFHPIESVLVRFSTIIEWNIDEKISSTFAAETFTDRNGEYSLEILTGHKYDVIASPPASNELGIYNQETITEVQPDDPVEERRHKMDLELKRRIQVTVNIVDDATGQPVRGTPANRAAVVSNLTTGGEAENVSVATEANADGICLLNLDSDNTYDLTIYPPVGSDLAMHTEHNYIALAGPARTLEVRLRNGLWIVGQVLTAGGDPLGGLTLVEAFDEPQGSDDARKIGIGANLGFSQSDGSFRVLIPPPEEE